MPLTHNLIAALLGFALADWLKIAGATLALYVIGKVVERLFISPISKVPGPLLSKLSYLPGTYYQVQLRLSEYFERMDRKYGKIHVFQPNFVILNDPSDARRVLSTHRYRKDPHYAAFNLAGDNIFTTSDPVLNTTRRKQIGPAFTQAFLAQMEPTVIEHGIRAIKAKWDAALAAGGREANYCLDFVAATFDVISALGFGQHAHTLDGGDARVFKWTSDFGKLGAIKLGLTHIERPPFKYLVRRLLASRAAFAAYAQRAVLARKELVARGARVPDLLQTFVDAQEPGAKAHMTAAQIASESIIMLLAGTETTAHTMTWTMHYLLLHPRALARAVAEVRARFGPGHTIGYAEGRAGLPFLEACILEAMRIRPVAGTALTRVVPEGGATFQGYFVPAGTVVAPGIPGLCKSAELWDDPHRFVPERFLGAGGEAARQNLFVFGVGVRACPGRNLAWVEMITILANLLKDYDFAIPEGASYGPDVVDGEGMPVPIARVHFLITSPKNPKDDCRVVISKAPLRR